MENGEIRFRGRGAALALALLLALPVGACERLGLDDEPPPVPSAAEVERHYDYAGELSVEISGNVAQVSVVVDPEEYARGGDLWAKAFPYIFLFSPATRDAFREHPGLAGIRVMVLHPNGDLMSQALLERGTLTGRGWQMAFQVAGDARREGTERPGLMHDLVRWGEDRTEFQYNPDYISTR